jgi:hypothetical protein
MTDKTLRPRLGLTGIAALASMAACAPADLPGGFSDNPPPGHASDPCGTGAWWTGGNEESPRMHPGGDCISCHARGEGPDFAVAGTVMTDTDDATDCMGVEGVTITLRDNAGEILAEMHSNAAGNFYTNAALPQSRLPYTVELASGGRTSAMATPQTETDCMACHTADGANGAPGRILAP